MAYTRIKCAADPNLTVLVDWEQASAPVLYICDRDGPPHGRAADLVARSHSTPFQTADIRTVGRADWDQAAADLVNGHLDDLSPY